MKNTFYLYELDRWQEIIPQHHLEAMSAWYYIRMHINRLQELLESESHIASDKYALENDTCPIGAYGKIQKDRMDALQFWQNKLSEL